MKRQKSVGYWKGSCISKKTGIKFAKAKRSKTFSCKTEKSRKKEGKKKNLAKRNFPISPHNLCAMRWNILLGPANSWKVSNI